MADMSASETRTEFEEQKRIIRELRDRLAEKEFQVVEGEKLRKKLHNTILVTNLCSFLVYHIRFLLLLSVVRLNGIHLNLLSGIERKYSCVLSCTTFATRRWCWN